MELTGITLDIRTFLGIVGGLRLRDLTLFIHIDAANVRKIILKFLCVVSMYITLIDRNPEHLRKNH